MGTTDFYQLYLTSRVKTNPSTDKMRCFILLALIAAASAIPFNGRSRKFNFPCGKGKNFKIPAGAKKIDLKNPTNLPEGWKVVKDPSEMELPDGLTFEDLKNGDVQLTGKRSKQLKTAKVLSG